MERLTLPADLLRTKLQLEQKWSDLVYQGLWFTPLKEALDGFVDITQQDVNGLVRIRLHKGNAIILGRDSSTSSLYMQSMATYGSNDQFDHKSAEGFIYIWGLPSRIWASAKRMKDKN